MSNDRLYLVCRICGDAIGLFKYYPGGGFIPPESHEGPNGGDIGAWLDEHIHTYDTPIPEGNVPELMNEDQATALGPELRRRKEWWESTDTWPPGVADRSPFAT